MSENPYSQMAREGPLSDAVDKAVAAEDERAIAAYGPEDAERDRANAVRWAALTAAQGVAQGYGVVLPIATVEEIVKVLKGEPSKFDDLSASLLERMVTTALAEARVAPEEQR